MKKIDNPQTVECPQLDAPRQLLWRAAEIMQQRGKCEDRLSTPDGRVCAMGALNAAATGDPQDGLDLRHTYPGFLAAWVALNSRCSPDPIFVWSDAHDQAEVVSTLRELALS
jgi:hypothetical protein